MTRNKSHNDHDNSPDGSCEKFVSILTVNEVITPSRFKHFNYKAYVTAYIHTKRSTALRETQLYGSA